MARMLSGDGFVSKLTMTLLSTMRSVGAWPGHATPSTSPSCHSVTLTPYSDTDRFPMRPGRVKSRERRRGVCLRRVTTPRAFGQRRPPELHRGIPYPAAQDRIPPVQNSPHARVDGGCVWQYIQEHFVWFVWFWRKPSGQAGRRVEVTAHGDVVLQGPVHGSPGGAQRHQGTQTLAVLACREGRRLVLPQKFHNHTPYPPLGTKEFPKLSDRVGAGFDGPIVSQVGVLRSQYD